MNQREKNAQLISRPACLSASSLKLIAMALMLVDHIGAVLYPYWIYPDMLWLRIVGRLSFPIFAFFVAEGYIKTGNRLKYILRMLIFALVSEIPFDLAVSGEIFATGCNIGFTFLIALAAMLLSDEARLRIEVKYPYWMGETAGCAIVVISALLAEWLHTDYGWYGVMLIFVYRMLHDNFWKKHIVATLFQILTGPWIQKYSAFSTLLLMLYNGEKGRNLKYLFYIFYPAHLLVLAILVLYIK